MNELYLKEVNADRIIYIYRPEGRGDSGEIIYDFTKQEATVAKRATEDDTGYYGNKAMYKVEQCVEKNNLPIKFTQAWY